MKKLIPILLILTITISLFAGCTRQNGVKINYQTFNSGNISFSAEDEELLPQEEIDFIIQLGKDLGFEVEYPEDWKSEYYILGIGDLSIIFYPENTELDKSITIDLLTASHEPITTSQLKTEFRHHYVNYTEEEVQVNNDLFVWKIIGENQFLDQKYQNFDKGTAFILYNNTQVYQMNTFFKDSDSTNLKIFNHMAISFSK